MDCGLQLKKLGHVVEVLLLLCLATFVLVAFSSLCLFLSSVSALLFKFYIMLQDFLGWIMVLRWAIQGRNVVEDWNVW